jgi:hypothetical protein
MAINAQKYFIKAYNTNYVFLTRLNFPIDLSFGVDMEGNGVLSFQLNILDPILVKFDVDNRKNIFELYNEGVLWRVYYLKDNVQYTSEKVQFRCVDYIQKLTERVVASKTFNGVAGGTSAQTLVTEANTGTNRDTFITNGVTDISTLIYKQLDYQAAFDALVVIRDTVNAQMVLNTDLSLDFVSSYGNTLTERLIYNYSDPRNSTIKDFTVLRDFGYIANDVTGKAGVTTSNETDSTSISKYGLTERFVSFPDAALITDLNNSTTEYKNEHREARLLPQVQIDNAKIPLSCYNIGDKLPLFIYKGSLAIEGTYQIVSINVTVDDTSNETVQVTLSENTVNNRNPDILNFINNLDKRLKYIELNA